MSKVEDWIEMEFINCETRAEQSPETFKIPDEDDRWGLQIDDFAKIGITSPNGAERFWVKITEVREVEGEKCIYAGTVHNDLVVFQIPFGERLEFDPCHVLSIIKEKRTVH